MRRRADSLASQLDWLRDAALWTPPTTDERLRAALELERLPVRAVYRLDEAQRLLRYNMNHMRRLVQEGELPFIRPRFRGDLAFIRMEYLSLKALFEQDVATLPNEEDRLRFALELEGMSARGTYRIDEVERLFRVSEMSVRRMVESGDLQAVQARHGMAVRIDFLSLRGLFRRPA